MKGISIEPPRRATYDDRLRVRAMRGEPDAVEAALAMMERRDPISLEQALELVLEGGEPSLARSPSATGALIAASMTPIT